MDTITHIAIGACVGEVFLGKKLGKRALLLGAIANSIPDIDFVASVWMSLVKEAANVLMNNHSKYFIVIQNGEVEGTINRMEIIKAIAEMRYDETIQSLMKENLKCFDGEKNVEEVLDKMSENQERIYPVLQNSHFAGVINFQHIIEYLLIHKAATNDYGRIKSLAGLL